MMEIQRLRLFPAAALMLALSHPAFGADAGSVTFASGTVTAERTPAAVLGRGDTVLVEDNVITAAASRAQLLMIDGAKIAIRPNSRIAIEEYVYAAAGAGTSATIATSAGDSSVIGLVKGGFRTITGAIGKEDPANYEVRTAVGVLGIRGTDFAVLLCGGDCNAAPGVPAGSVVPDGLYIMVSEGSVFFSNELATIDINAGEFVFIPLAARRPERLDTTPPVFIDDSDLRFVADDAQPTGFDAELGTRRAPATSAPDTQGADQGDSGSPEAPKQSIQGIDADGTPVDLTPGGAPDPQNRTISYSSGPLGPANAIFSGTVDNASGRYRLDSGNNVTGFDSLYPDARTGPGPAGFDIGSSANVETGFDSMTVMRWGRWAGGTASITLADGTDASQDLGAQSLHWISSPGWLSAPAMPQTGTANYALIGSTAPTDNFGNTGVLGDASLFADFLNMRVDSTLAIDIAGSTWTAAGQGDIGAAAQLPAHLFDGIFGTVSIDGIGGGTGVFSGFFSEPGPASDPSYPGGAGLTFTLQDQGGTTTVSGAAAFGNP